MISATIHDNEKLYRVIRFLWWNAKRREVSPAAFVDNNGVSVDRIGDRTEEEVINSLKSRFQRRPHTPPDNVLKAIASITAGECRELDTYVCYTKSKKLYHSSIWDSETVKKITLPKAFLLSKRISLVSVDGEESDFTD